MFRRLIEARLSRARRVAAEAVDGLDDRSALFMAELAAEQRRLTHLVLFALGALLVAILAVVWSAATLVAVMWDTEWRQATLVGVLIFWILFAAWMAMKARSLLAAGSEAFRFTRRVAADDLEQFREVFK